MIHKTASCFSQSWVSVNGSHYNFLGNLEYISYGLYFCLSVSPLIIYPIAYCVPQDEADPQYLCM